MLAIIHATLVMRDHLIPDGILVVEDGKIRSFGEMREHPIPEGCEILDAHGLYVGPGFVDIHTHSDGNIFFSDDPKAVGHHLRHGTTTLLAALYFSMNAEELTAALGRLRIAMADPECKNLAGVYMEGPYLNPKFGCDKEHNPWSGPICREKYQPVIDAGWDIVKVWVLAPERENILDFVLDVKAKNPAAIFAVGHSEASPQQIETLIPYGLRIGTHHTNATGDRIFYPEVRGVCVDEAVNYNSDIYAELICDSRGIHVDPYMLRLVRKIKGGDRILLISDAYACDGPVPPGYEGVDDINFDHTGEIAGSRMTLDIACRNMLKHTGSSIVDVFRYASYNPARAVGFYDRGEIAVGKRADLVVVDHWMKVDKVIFEGKVQ